MALQTQCDLVYRRLRALNALFSGAKRKERAMVMGVAAVASPMDEYFRSNAPRTKQITQRVSKRVFDGVKYLAEVLTLEEQILHGDPKAKITVGDVVNRLLELGLDSAFARLDLSQPMDKDQQQQVLAVYEKRLKQSK
jgi:hypothetical protein